MDPEYPLYIVSKGRWDTSKTSRALSAMGVYHTVVVEAQEYEQYRTALTDAVNVIVLPSAYQQGYDTCDDLGDSKSKGPGAARNFVWDHSLECGYKWHWVLDDNISGFYRLIKNLKVSVADGTIFRCMEEFAQRYENVGMVGPNYHYFAKRKQKLPPFITNTRIYSCNLIRNDVPYRWRGRYNEDTDLSLRMLKDRWCTIQFNAFLQGKAATQTVKGGNTAEFYEKEGTLPKSEMQVNLHPDVSRLTWKFGRWHHQVDYRRFTTPLRRKPDVEISQEIDEHGMVYQVRRNGEWVDGNS